MPDRVYADQQMLYAAEEAAELRAKARGETAPAGNENGELLHQNAPRPADGAGRDDDTGGSK